MGINDIIKNYTSGKASVEETNAALKAEGAGFHFEPGQNALTDSEIASTRVGTNPSDATGYGLLDNGTGSAEKVRVVGGVVQGGRINTIVDGHPNERDLVYIGGQVWQVYGDKLGEPEAEDTPWWVPYHVFAGAVSWKKEISKYIPEKDMMFNRPKYHGQEVVKGAVRYIYANDGTAQYQPKSMRDYDLDHGRA